MWYEFHIETPANTLQTDPLLTELQLDAGAITAVELLFPPGCVGLVHLQISRELHQVWPANADGFIAGDTFPIRWSESYELGEPPYVLEARTWNNDKAFDHVVTVRFEFVPWSAWQRRQRAMLALDYLARWWATQPEPAP